MSATQRLCCCNSHAQPTVEPHAEICTLQSESPVGSTEMSFRSSCRWNTSRTESPVSAATLSKSPPHLKSFANRCILKSLNWLHRRYVAVKVSRPIARTRSETPAALIAGAPARSMGRITPAIALTKPARLAMVSPSWAERFRQRSIPMSAWWTMPAFDQNGTCCGWQKAIMSAFDLGKDSFFEGMRVVSRLDRSSISSGRHRNNGEGTWETACAGTPSARLRLPGRSRCAPFESCIMQGTPDARLGEFETVAGRVAKINRPAATGPLEVGLDREPLNFRAMRRHRKRPRRGRFRVTLGLKISSIWSPQR